MRSLPLFYYMSNLFFFFFSSLQRFKTVMSESRLAYASLRRAQLLDALWMDLQEINK